MPPNCLWTVRKRCRRRPKGVRPATLRSFFQSRSLPCLITSRSMPFIRSSRAWGTISMVVILRSRMVRERNGGLSAGGIGDAGTGVQGEKEAAHLLIHVAEREDGQEPAGRVDGDVLGDAFDVGGEITVGEHYTLRISGGAGGEHNFGEIVGVDGDRVGGGEVGDG